MNREFKFRVWDIVNKDFTYSPNRHFLIGLGGDLFDGAGCSYDELHIVQQFTGLKDKNGKEIYEGDIVSIKDDFYKTNIKFIVIFNYGTFGLEHDNEIKILAIVYPKCEVIGNIHENPELLK